MSHLVSKLQNINNVLTIVRFTLGDIRPKGEEGDLSAGATVNLMGECRNAESFDPNADWNCTHRNA